MDMPAVIFIIIISIACFSQEAWCAGVVADNKAPQAVWAKLALGESQDLIVEFDARDIMAQAAQLNIEKKILFDDNDTIRFKSGRYAVIKAEVLSTLTAGKVDILNDYDVLPLMFLRIRSADALRTLLSYPAVLRVYENRKENLTTK